jgi:hypothetical protein
MTRWGHERGRFGTARGRFVPVFLVTNVVQREKSKYLAVTQSSWFTITEPQLSCTELTAGVMLNLQGFLMKRVEIGPRNDRVMLVGPWSG